MPKPFVTRKAQPEPERPVRHALILSTMLYWRCRKRTNFWSMTSRRILTMKAMTIPAKYENGVFRPLQEVRIREGTLVEVNVPAETPAPSPRSIGDTPFAGMWKDREDMADSVEYISRLRRELHD